MKKNLLNYIKNFKNVSFDEVSFNSIDALFLCTLSYFDFEYNNEIICINKLYDYLIPNVQSCFKGMIMTKKIIKLPEMILGSKRYTDICLVDYVEEIDFDIEKQFAVMTFLLPNNSIFIAYRGSDNTLMGWKEDFNLAYLDFIPSQESALKYFIKIAEKYNDKKIYIGGYSKAGNLAVYAALKGSNGLLDRIEQVYNFDGPGLLENFSENKTYLNIKNRIISISPRASIVGKLLNCGELKEIKSSNISILQHEVTSWKIEKNDFLYTNKTSRLSDLMVFVVNRVVRLMDREEIECHINDLFNSLYVNGIKYMSDIRKNFFKSFISIIPTLKKVTKRMSILKKNET